MPKRTAELVIKQADLFNMMARAALKAKVSRLKAGQSIRLGGFDFIMEEDDCRRGIVILTSQPREYIEKLAYEIALELGLNIHSMNDNEKEEWMIQFYKWLKDLLRERYEIIMSLDRGYMINFEMPTYKIDKSWR